MTQMEAELRKAGFTPSTKTTNPESIQGSKNSKEKTMSTQTVTNTSKSKSQVIDNPEVEKDHVEMKGKKPESTEEVKSSIEADLKKITEEYERQKEELSKYENNDDTWLPSNRTTVDNIVLGLGAGITIIGVVALGIFYATAGMAASVAIVLFIIDAAMVLLFGGLATFLAYGIKQILSELIDGFRSKKDNKKEAKEEKKGESSAGQPASSAA